MQHKDDIRNLIIALSMRVEGLTVRVEELVSKVKDLDSEKKECQKDPSTCSVARALMEHLRSHKSKSERLIPLLALIVSLLTPVLELASILLRHTSA